MFVTLAQVRELLQQNGLPDAFIVFDEEAMRKLAGTEKEKLIWGFDTTSGDVRNVGNSHYAGRYVQHPGGYGTFALVEEQNGYNGDPDRIIGEVTITVNDNYRIKVRETLWLDGPGLECQPSSLSKGELSENGECVGYFRSNAQRIMGGRISVVVIEQDFPDEDGQTINEFMEKCKLNADGRSLSALMLAIHANKLYMD